MQGSSDTNSHPAINTAKKTYETVGMSQTIISVLWPSFIMAAIASILFWMAVDPDELRLITGIDLSRTGMYSLGFFISWVIIAASSLLSIRFCKPCALVNK